MIRSRTSSESGPSPKRGHWRRHLLLALRISGLAFSLYFIGVIVFGFLGDRALFCAPTPPCDGHSACLIPSCPVLDALWSGALVSLILGPTLLAVWAILRLLYRRQGTGWDPIGS